MAFELPASPSSSDHRDFRSGNKDHKRVKNFNVKWAHGVRPSVNPTAPERLRPVRTSLNMQPSFMHKHNQQNIVKFTRGNKPWMPAGRVRAQTDALFEIDDARRQAAQGHDSLSGSLDLAGFEDSVGESKNTTAQAQDTSSLLYSFDNTDSPPPALTLDLFVKPTTARATEKLVEKLVEKEYEVLDDNGDAVRGRKARHMLRNKGPATARAEADVVVVDDDFELI